MGRVSRYKRSKNVFQLDDLFQNDLIKDLPKNRLKNSKKKDLRQSGQDEIHDIKKSNPQWESKSKLRLIRNKIIKCDQEGKPLNQLFLIKKNKQKEQMNKKSVHLKEFKLEKRQKDESLYDFQSRINRETKQKLLEQSKHSCRKAIKGKEHLKLRREKLRQKKINKEKKSHENLTDKEKQFYKIGFIQKGIKQPVQTPPTFSTSNTLKKCSSNPNDRSRHAKFSSNNHPNQLIQKDKKNMTKYQVIQLDEMQKKIEQKYKFFNQH